jgi:hypothetical protein
MGACVRIGGRLGRAFELALACAALPGQAAAAEVG